MDYCDKSITSPTLCSSSSSSPSSEDDDFERNYIPPLDLTLLEAKVAALGLTRYTAYPSALKGRRSLNSVNSSTSSSSYPSSEEEEDDVFMVNSRDGKNHRRPPMLRSKSLKTGITPPETPKKKVVRFADSLGLNFEYIRLISQDELPIIPKSAYQHLKLSMTEKNLFFKDNK